MDDIFFFTAHHNLGGVGAVDPDAHDEQVQDLGRNQVRLRHLFVVAPCDVGLHHCHAVHSERAGLVRADGRGVAHRLTGIQVADQVIVLHHFLKKEEGSVTRVRMLILNLLRTFTGGKVFVPGLSRGGQTGTLALFCGVTHCSNKR